MKTYIKRILIAIKNILNNIQNNHKRLLAISLCVCLIMPLALLTLTANGASNSIAEKILDFETQDQLLGMWANEALPVVSNPTLSFETTNPLNGAASQKIEIPTGFTGGWIGVKTPSPVGGTMGEFGGIVFRIKISNTPDKTYRMSFRPFFGENGNWMDSTGVLATDVSGQIISGAGAKFGDMFYVPANFDGYIFCPKPATFDMTTKINMNMWFSTGDAPSNNGWSGATVIMDDFYYYSSTETKSDIIGTITDKALPPPPPPQELLLSSTASNNDTQNWELKSVENNGSWFYIKNVASGLYLTCASSSEYRLNVFSSTSDQYWSTNELGFNRSLVAFNNQKAGLSSLDGKLTTSITFPRLTFTGELSSLLLANETTYIIDPEGPPMFYSGTVVFPESETNFYLTSGPKVIPGTNPELHLSKTASNSSTQSWQLKGVEENGSWFFMKNISSGLYLTYSSGTYSLSAYTGETEQFWSVDKLGISKSLVTFSNQTVGLSSLAGKLTTSALFPAITFASELNNLTLATPTTYIINPSGSELYTGTVVFSESGVNYYLTYGIVPVTPVNNTTAIIPIFDFESTEPFTTTATSNSMLSVATNKSSMTIGDNSLSIGYAPLFIQEAIKADVAISSNEYTGIIFRLKMDVINGAKMKLILEQGGQTIYLGRNVKFISYLGDLANATPSYDDTQQVVFTPMFFDGFVFFPLSGKFTGSGNVDATLPFSLKIEFSNTNTRAAFNGSETCIDNIGYYNNTDYIKLMNLLDPNREKKISGDTGSGGSDPGTPSIGDDSNSTPSTIVTTSNTVSLVDFENGAQPIKSQDKTQENGKDVYRIIAQKITDKPLIGSASLKLVGQENLSPWAHIDTIMPGVEGSYDGLFIRIKTNASYGAILRSMFFQDSTQIGIGKTPICLDKYGNDITIENPEDKSWQGVKLPSNFDGFVFMPFSGQYADPATGKTIDATREFTFWYLFAENFTDEATWIGTETFIDNTGFYKGNDFKQIIMEIDPSTDFNGSGGPTPGADSGTITDETPYINEQYGIELTGFSDGVLPNKTQLLLTKLDNSKIKTAYNEFIAVHNARNDEIVGTYDLFIANGANKLMDPRGLVSVTFTVPDNYIAENLGICFYDANDGKLKYFKTQETTDYNDNPAVKCYSKVMGTFALINVGAKVSDLKEETNETSSNNANSDVSSSPVTEEPDTTATDILTNDIIDRAIKATTGNTVIISVKELGVLTTEMQQKLLDANKALIVKLKDENGDIQLAWQFDIFTKTVDNIDLSLNEISPNKTKIEKLANGAIIQIISFKYQGDLPNNVKIVIKNIVGFIKGSLLVLKGYNTNTDSLDLIDKNPVLSADGKYLQLEINKCMDYAIINEAKNAVEPPKDTPNNSLIIILIIALILIVTAIVIAVVLVILKKKVQK